jgi:hypothetical protein
MNNCLRRLIAFGLVLAGAASLGALEIREGRIKLVLQETTGRFSLYFQTDIQKNSYQPLFVDQDPRTSFLSILVDDKAVRLGDTTAFRIIAEKTDRGARFRFESTLLMVTETFSFITAGNSGMADGVSVELAVLNKYDRDIQVGLRFQLDTNLGEKGAEHFATDQRSISAEAYLQNGQDTDRWWFSRSENYGLMGSLFLDGVDKPSSVHFANWKRLNDAAWKAAPAANRNFNLLPYSIGDSAISYVWDAQGLARGAERKATLLLAVANQNGFATAAAQTDDAIGRMLRQSVEAAETPEMGWRTDLITMRDLLERVDAYLAGQAPLSDDEIAGLEAIIARLKERNGL